jgi:hypothetical protein
VIAHEYNDISFKHTYFRSVRVPLVKFVRMQSGNVASALQLVRDSEHNCTTPPCRPREHFLSREHCYIGAAQIHLKHHKRQGRTPPFFVFPHCKTPPEELRCAGDPLGQGAVVGSTQDVRYQRDVLDAYLCNDNEMFKRSTSCGAGQGRAGQGRAGRRVNLSASNMINRI